MDTVFPDHQVGILPTSLWVNGKAYAIRTDFRFIIRIHMAFNDPELEDNEKVYVCLCILYEDFEDMPKSDYEAAFLAALEFIDHGVKGSEKNPPRLMDWEHDEDIIFAAVNKTAGFEVRSVKYLHWWTFIGYFMEMGEGVFTRVLGLRMKKSKGKPLEKWEREYWNANKTVCVLEAKLTEEEKAAKDRLNALLG